MPMKGSPVGAYFSVDVAPWTRFYGALLIPVVKRVDLP